MGTKFATGTFTSITSVDCSTEHTYLTISDYLHADGTMHTGPRPVYFYEWPDSSDAAWPRDAGLSKAGKKTKARGYTINFTAPGGKTGYKKPAAAESFLLKNLHCLKLPYLGFLEFNPGDAERVMERGAVLAKAGVDEDEE